MSNGNFFNIRADFDLNVKPPWLDDFRSKYDLPHDYHITFKTTTKFKSEDFENLNTELKIISKSHRPFIVVFDELFISSTSSGWCMMIKAQYNQELFDLQKEVAEKFSKYGDHTTKERESFEKNFDPHVTIARHLTPEQLRKAKRELKKDLMCEALINSLTLATVKEDTFEEWSNPANRIFYKLK
ncbi:2'-5' RNA ligase family protein [Patescibacteria group bacterium AH-259-L05]|nr:2'-5' RNA ligase family protein [Patescibacteria group bacterium AH-259-L05]